MLKYVKLNERWILICEVCIQVGLHVQEIIRNVSKAHLEERLNEGREEDEQKYNTFVVFKRGPWATLFTWKSITIIWPKLP